MGCGAGERRGDGVRAGFRRAREERKGEFRGFFPSLPPLTPPFKIFWGGIFLLFFGTLASISPARL